MTISLSQQYFIGSMADPHGNVLPIQIQSTSNEAKAANFKIIPINA